MLKFQMPRKIEIKLKLPKKDLKILKTLLSGGVKKVRTIKRANVLMQMNKGISSAKAGAAAGVSPETARAIVARYKKNGINGSIYDAPRPGGAPLLNNSSGSKIIAMVCSDPPKGNSRWTLELISEEATKRKIVKTIGRETVRILLHCHDIKPWREKNVVCT